MELWFTVLPEFITYNAAISTCDPSEEWQQALGLLAEARNVDLVPIAITYDAWLSFQVLLAAGAARAQAMPTGESRQIRRLNLAVSNTSSFTSGANRDELTQIAGRSTATRPGLSTEDNDEGLGDDDDLSPPPEEVEVATGEADKVD